MNTREHHPAILVLSFPGDFHAVTVVEALRRRGESVVHWHTTDYPHRAPETIRIDATGTTVSLPGPGLAWPARPIKAVWNRRRKIVLDENVLHPADLAFAEKQCTRFRGSLAHLLAPDALWVNREDVARSADLKPLQQRVAADLGFVTPPTLYSNDPAAIRGFIREQGGAVIFKGLSQDSNWHDDDNDYYCPITRLTEEHLVGDEQLKSCPAIYQAEVPKAYELRITVMGDRVFAARINSQQTAKGRLDFREAYDELTMEPVMLDCQVELRCRQLLRRLGLVYGAIDMVATPDGELVFLEVNESGQFLWVEDYTEQPLLSAFCALLASGRPDFTWQPDGIRAADFDVWAAARHEMETHTKLPNPSRYEGPATCSS